MPPQVLDEALEVEAQLLGVVVQVGRAQRVLVFEEQIVHLPEPLLGRRRLSCLGGQLGVRVDVVQRQVPPDVAQIAEVGE